MVATILVGPGKPKLMQIQRATTPHSQAASISALSATPRQSRPSTPVQSAPEISAFSPYDTPGPVDIPRQTPDVKVPSSTVAESLNASRSSQTLLPPPLSLPSRRRSSHSDSSAFSRTLQYLQHLADPFGTPITAHGSPKRPRSQYHDKAAFSRQSSPSSWPIDAFPRPRTHRYFHGYDQEVWPTSELAGLKVHHKLHKLGRILDALVTAIESFPRSGLNLDTPMVRKVRPLHISEDKYVNALRKVFPTSSTLLLSCFAAWVIIDLYLEKELVQCAEDESHNKGSWTQPDDCRVRQSLCNVRCNDGILRSHEPRSFHRYHHEDDLFPYTITNPERGARLPHKAREILGVDDFDPIFIQQRKRALEERSRTVQVSVRVICQRLVGALRGRWHEDIWNALRCLIEKLGVMMMTCIPPSVGDYLMLDHVGFGHD